MRQIGRWMFFLAAIGVVTHANAQGDQVAVVDWTPPASTIDPGYVATAKLLLGNGLSDPTGGRFCSIPLKEFPAEPQFGWVRADGKSAVMLDGVERPVVGAVTPVSLDQVVNQIVAMRNTPFGGTFWVAGLPAVLLLAGKVDLAEKVYNLISSKCNGFDTSYFLFGDIQIQLDREAGFAMTKHDDKRGEAVSGRLVAAYKLQNQRKWPLYVPDATKITQEAIDLHADFERRVEHPESVPLDTKSLARLSKAKRIEALVDHLDEIQYRGKYPSERMTYPYNGISGALVSKGEDAVPALIDAMENDRRFTRIVNPGAALNGTFTFVSVRAAAWETLLSIWPAAEALSAPGYVPVRPPESTAALRSEWAKESKLTQQERFLKILEDDSADSRNWVQAAQYLVKPKGQVGKGSSLFGEPLRASRGSEVLNVFGKRALALSSRNTGGSTDGFAFADGLRIAHFAYVWDSAHSLDVLKQASAGTLEGMIRIQKLTDQTDSIAGPFGAVIADRIALGDHSAIKDYNLMIPRVKFGFGYPADFLKPLWTAPSDPSIVDSGKLILKSLVNDIESPKPGESIQASQAVLQQATYSPILEFRPFRDLMIRILKSERMLGEGVIEGSGTHLDFLYQLPDVGSGAFGLNGDEALGARLGQKIPVSESDLFALNLTTTSFRGLPTFSIALPVAERQKQKDRLIQFFRNDRFDWRDFQKKSPFYSGVRE